MQEKLQNEQACHLAEQLHGKRILVTGATGLIGSQVVLYLVYLNETYAAGIRVIALYRSEQKRSNRFSALSERKDVIFVKCDIEEEIPYEGAVDYIVHGAGFSGGSKLHLTDPIKVFDTGIRGTKNMLDFAVKHACRGILYISTYEVYGDTSQEQLITEGQACALDTFSLRNCYAEIKRLCESLLCAYSAQYGLLVYSARLTSTFGSGVRYNDPRFFTEFARCVLEGKDIVLKSEGKTVRSYLDVRDAATAFLYILTHGESGNAYNVTNMKNEVSIRDMALKMIEVAKSPVRLIIDSQDRAPALGYRKEGRTVMDASKLQALGWRPAYSLDETITSLLESMRTQMTI